MKASTLSTLGSFVFRIDGTPANGPATRKARALLAYLVMARGADCSRERLVELFWPDVEPDRGRDSLSTALHSIRSCMRAADAAAERFFVATRTVVRWQAQTALDALEFCELAKSHDRDAQRRAVEMYRGDFLEGDYDAWSSGERERLSALYESLLTKLVGDLGDLDAAYRLVERNPYNEEAYCVIIDAELKAGRRASSVAWIERCKNALAEVGESISEAFEVRRSQIVAGDVMRAAQGYLSEARDALTTMAFENTMELCDAGLREAAMLGRISDGNALAFELNRTAACAALARGLPDVALKYMRESAAANGAQNLPDSATAALEVAAIEGTLLLPDRQLAANFAFERARQSNDVLLQARALIECACAARETGCGEIALVRAKTARTLAVQAADTLAEASAFAEVLRTQASWWHFADAVETANAYNAATHFEEALSRAEFFCARSQLLYLMDNFDAALADLQSGLRLAREHAAPPPVYSIHGILCGRSHVEFCCLYMLAKIAIARGEIDAALDACAQAAELTVVARLPRYSIALTLLRIDALLEKRSSANDRAADELAVSLPNATGARGMFGWSDSPALARCRIAARAGTGDAARQLRSMLDVLEDEASDAPLDCNAAFERLTQAALAFPYPALAQRAAERSKYYYDKRKLAAAVCSEIVSPAALRSM